MFTRQLIYKVYSENDTYLGVLDDVISDFSIVREINGGDSEFTFELARKFDDFDENVTIKFNNRIRVYLKDSYHPLGDMLIAYGYIVAYSPFLNGKNEGLSVTCLSAVSKLSNDFYRTGNSLDASDLGIELASMRADEMMQAIITHYRTTETNLMISNDFTNVEHTTDGAGAETTFTTRFFNMKHLDAIREAAKFLPKNKTDGHWQYWRISTDGKLYVKTLSTTADHSLVIGKHISAIDGEKSMMDIINRVYFWNEKGTVDPDYLNIVNDDTTSQTDHDIMSEYVTDSKITNSVAAGLLTNAKLYDNKDPKVTIKVTMTSDYDLASITPGQTCTLLNAKNNPYKIGSDNVLLIESIEYSVDSAVLSLSNGHVSFEDIIEDERQSLDKQMRWFGYITQQLTAAQLAPASRTWSTNIKFAAATDANAYRKITWTAGTVYLPTTSGTDAGKRVITSGNTGNMAAATDYYIYLDEETIDVTAATEVSGAAGIIVQGGDALTDSSKTWTNDQYRGYIVTIGGQTRIIKSNTASVLIIENRWSIADTTGAYTIKKMQFNVTSDRDAVSDDTKVIFFTGKASADTSSEATGATSGSEIDNIIINQDNIAKNCITADEISTDYLYAGEIDADQITSGVLTGIVIQTESSGQRVVLQSTLAEFYDSADKKVAQTYANESMYLIKSTVAGGDIGLFCDDTGYIVLGYYDGALQGVMQIDSAGVKPLASGYDLGASGYYWDTAYIVDGIFDTSITLNGADIYDWSDIEDYLDLDDFVTLAGTQTITGSKTFSRAIVADGGIYVGPSDSITCRGYLFLSASGNEWLYDNGTNVVLAGHGKTFTLNGNKTAILPTSEGYNALYCTESPEVWFMDFCTEKDKLDPMFKEVTSAPYHYIKCEDGEYQVWGKRKGHEMYRFEQKTYEEYIANEMFLNLNKPGNIKMVDY